MCGRYTHLYTWQQIHDQLTGFLTSLQSALAGAPGPDPNYNVSPKGRVPVAIRRDGCLVAASMQWWLVPHWAKTPDSRYATFNARSEDAHTKPAFRSAFRSGRCVVPVSGFYEWRKNTDGTKTPMYITRADGEPLLFAGLTDSWGDPAAGELLETCTVLTTSPNAEMELVHSRMPCVLEPEQIEGWMDADRTVDDARSMLNPAADGLLIMHEVGRAVGKVTNQGAGLIEPMR